MIIGFFFPQKNRKKRKFPSPNSYTQLDYKLVLDCPVTQNVSTPEAGASPDGSKHNPVKQIYAVMPRTTRKQLVIVLIPCLINS